MSSRLLIMLCLLCPYLSSFSQNSPFPSMDSVFNSYVEELDRDFLEYVEQMDEDFSDYLGQEWEPFDAVDLLYDSYENRKTESEYLTPVGLTDFPFYPKRENRIYKSISFTFLGEQANVKVDTEIPFKLRTTLELEISMVWRKLTLSDFSTIINFVKESRNKLNLNDWGVYLLVSQTGDQLFDSKHSDEKSVFCSFILTHLGYDVRLGRKEDINKQSHIILLLPFESRVYRMKRITVDDKYFYLEGFGENDSFTKLYSYRKNLAVAKSNINLMMDKVPQCGSVLLQKTFDNKIPQNRLVLKCKKALNDYYATFPNTELNVYLNTPLSDALLASLRDHLQPMLKTNKKNEAVGVLLRWFYSTFPYRLDEDEKTLFAEQTVLHRYSDCEDRAILFARIVNEILGMDTALFVFDDHVATGVSFDEKTQGFTLKYNNKNYTICDPSSQQSAVGYIMPQYSGKPVKIIPLNK